MQPLWWIESRGPHQHSASNYRNCSWLIVISSYPRDSLSFMRVHVHMLLVTFTNCSDLCQLTLFTVSTRWSHTAVCLLSMSRNILRIKVMHLGGILKSSRVTNVLPFTLNSSLMTWNTRSGFAVWGATGCGRQRQQTAVSKDKLRARGRHGDAGPAQNKATLCLMQQHMHTNDACLLWCCVCLCEWESKGEGRQRDVDVYTLHLNDTTDSARVYL